MKKGLFIYCMLMLSITSLFAKEMVTLAIGEWAPYTSSSQPNGKMAEVIVKEAFKLEDIDVKYKYYPWKRAISLVKSADEVGTFPWYKTEQRQKEYIISKEAVIVSKTVFFHLKTLEFHWKEYKDLKKYRIGGTLGYTYTRHLNNKGLSVDEVPREELNFKKLMLGRIDVVPSDFFVGYSIIHQLYSAQKAAMFTNHPKAILDGNMYVLFSKNIPKSQELADKFDQGIVKLKKSGRYDEIISKFLFK